MEQSVTHSEREWILIGMAESCAERGYEQTTVADVCAAAGVSGEAFARAFADMDECLGAAMESFVTEGWRRLDEARSPGKAWTAELRDGVGALLELTAERPAFAHMALVDAPAAGGRAGALYASSRAALLAFVERGREQANGEAGLPASAGRGALAGAEMLLAGQIVAGKREELDALISNVVYMLAVPYLGRDEAQRLTQGPAKRGHLRAVA
jgi:AcrR family transcriptional regulator